MEIDIIVLEPKTKKELKKLRKREAILRERLEYIDKIKSLQAELRNADMTIHPDKYSSMQHLAHAMRNITASRLDHGGSPLYSMLNPGSGIYSLERNAKPKNKVEEPDVN